MPQSTPDELGGRIGFRVPSNVNTAYEQIANLKDFEAGAHATVNKSDILREALEEYLNNHYEELPEETRDLLDDDLIANAGGDAEEVEA